MSYSIIRIIIHIELHLIHINSDLIHHKPKVEEPHLGDCREPHKNVAPEACNIGNLIMYQYYVLILIKATTGGPLRCFDKVT